MAILLLVILAGCQGNIAENPASTANAGKWKVGECVFVRWREEPCWDPGTVKNIKTRRDEILYLIKYSDGDEG